jgi:hypothetical protein
MTSLAVFVLFAVGANRAEVRPEPALRFTITPAPDQSGRWCRTPVFRAVLMANRPLWLAMDGSEDLRVSRYSWSYSGLSDGAIRGRTHDWTTMEVLRSSAALSMKAGESLVRRIELDGVRLRGGTVHVTIATRIHGTDDLSANAPQTYDLEATVELTLRPRDRCFEVVRRLTRRCGRSPRRSTGNLCALRGCDCRGSVDHRDGLRRLSPVSLAGRKS